MIVQDYNPLNMFVLIQGHVTMNMNSTISINQDYFLNIKFTLFSALRKYESRFDIQKEIYHTKNHTIKIHC